MTFRHIYISVHPIGSVPIGAGSAMSRFFASCIRFHPVPSGGTCFPTLHNDRHVPELSRPLISVGQLDEDDICAESVDSMLEFLATCEANLILWVGPSEKLTLRTSLCLSVVLCWETCPSRWNRMEDAENRLIREPGPIGTDRLEGQRCKYAEKSYMCKYDLGHTFACVLSILFLKSCIESVS